MCNLYSLTKGQAVIREHFRVKYERTGDLPLFPSICPEQLAPIARIGADGERELVLARWGIPFAAPVRKVPITRIRYVRSQRWRPFLGLPNRCVIPATSFCEWADMRSHKTPKWFALGEGRPLFAFAGLWTRWRGAHRFKEGDRQVFGVLTTEANAAVASIHGKAMPVILAAPAEVDRWLEAEIGEALSLQRPLPNGGLQIVATGEEEDRPFV